MNRQGSTGTMLAVLILMATLQFLAAIAAGWWGRGKWDKPAPDVITERVIVRAACEPHLDCSRTGLIEHYRTCAAQKRTELVKPRG